MKKLGFLSLFFLLLLSSCAGTKYKNSAYTTPNHSSLYPSQTSDREDSVTHQDLNVESPEEVDLGFDYKITEDNSFLFSVTELVLNTAIEKLGTRYKAGGTNHLGFDCSGLVYSSFKQYNVTLPRSSHEMAVYTKKIKDSEVQRGDLIFFTTNGSRRINHVGIVTEVLDDEIKFVHSSTKLGVIISSTKEPYYKRTYAKVGRIQ